LSQAAASIAPAPAAFPSSTFAKAASLLAPTPSQVALLPPRRFSKPCLLQSSHPSNPGWPSFPDWPGAPCLHVCAHVNLGDVSAHPFYLRISIAHTCPDESFQSLIGKDEIACVVLRWLVLTILSHEVPFAAGSLLTVA
jgi:hypothetical protein